MKYTMYMFKKSQNIKPMQTKEFNRTTSFILFFISLLSFFLLWVFYADKVKDLYVKNILKSDENSLIFHEKLDVFWRKDLDLDTFWETYNLIRANYFDSSETQKSTLEQWATKGLVEALWDIHSEYLNPEETEQFNGMLAWDFEWIGAVVDKVDMWIVVERVLKWSPAKEFGVRNDDVILEANGEDLSELGLYEAVEKIKWPAWTKVALKIFRVWEKDFLEIEVTRQKITIPSVESEAIEWTDNFYIAVNMFGDQTVSEFLKALRESKSYDWLIIDLRDNWGWYLQSAVEILSEFVEDWKILVTTKYKNSQNNFSYKSRNSWEVYDKKIVILINENSASASEIVAWALSDYNKAVLVWKKSYGKWSVQQPFEFDDGWLLKITIAKWFTPKDRNIDNEWIEPDIEVTFEDEDYENKYDRQLEEAKKVLDIFKAEWGIGITLDRYKETQEGETVSDTNSQ